jgi:hypothetical protein
MDIAADMNGIVADYEKLTKRAEERMGNMAAK